MKLPDWAHDEEKIQIILAVIGGISLVASFIVQPGALPFDPAWIAVVLCGTPIVKEAAVSLITEFDIKADLLVSIGLIAAVCIGEVFAAGEIAFIMSLGSLLEEHTVARARKGIQKLVDLTPRTARVVKNTDTVTVPASQVEVGDIIRVIPGEIIPVDGVIISGQTAIDQSVMTGESMPVDKCPGDGVYSGTLNQFGAFDMRATRIEGDSSLQRMIRLVEAADASRTPIVRIIDRWASWIVVAALLTALGVWWFTGEAIRAVTILVVFCPCSLVLSTPTAIMAAIGRATRLGVLISSGDALERLAQINLVAFDKTGTLTFGQPEVTAICSFTDGLPEMRILELAAAAEQNSEHPLGKAIIRNARAKGITAREIDNFTAIPGMGVAAGIEGQKILVGTAALMKDKQAMWPAGSADPEINRQYDGQTIIYVAMAGKVAGIIALSDTLRPDAKNTVERLREQGLGTVLLTGDNLETATIMANKVGIPEMKAGLLPQDKMAIIEEELQADPNNKVCMIGDGVNDAPALKTAHVGIALGHVGSDIAVDAADAVLVHDEISRLPQLISLARRTVATIRMNIFLSLALNLVTVVLAAGGWMGPVVGALAHNAGAVLIVLNSTRLLRHGEKTA